MSLAIITYGFGSYGSVTLVPTYGFSSSSVTVDPPIDIEISANIVRSRSFSTSISRSKSFSANITRTISLEVNT